MTNHPSCVAAPPQLPYVATLSALVVVVLIGATYAIVQPLSTVFATLYFCAAFVSYKYQVRNDLPMC